MKRLSKLLALVLTGVMALTLLAGCSGGAALSEKEVLENLRDLIRLEQTENVTLDETNYARNAVKALQDWYKLSSEEHPGQTPPPVELLIMTADDDDFAELCEKVPAGSSDGFFICCAPVEQYQSSYFQNHQSSLLAQTLYYDNGTAYAYLTDHYNREKVAISLCMETFNGQTYAFLVYRSTLN